MMKTTHLSESQIDAVLMGSASRRAQAHLEGCETCRGHLAEAGASMQNFRAVAVAWSERKSATMPTSLSAALAHKASVRQPLAWSAAALTLFAVGLGTTMLMPGTRVPEAAKVQTSASSVAGSAEDMASDNQMLNEIDRELGTATPAALGLNDASSEDHGAASRVED